MSISCAADFADWYDGEARQYTDKVLTEFVDRNPNLFGVIVAGYAATTFDLGSVVFVDMARLGTGAADGSVKGVFQDILRALSVIPIGKVVTVGKPIVGRVVQALSNVFYWRRITGKACVPISLAQALQFTGQKLVVSLDEVVAGMGRTIESFDRVLGKGGSIGEIRKALTELKAVFEELPKGVTTTWDDLRLYAEGTDGVFLVPLKRVLNRAGGHLDTFHMVMVSKTSKGIQIFDRKGVFQTLDDLSRRYGSTTPSEFYQIELRSPIVIVKNWILDPALTNRLNAFGPLGAVVMRAAIALSFNPGVDTAEIQQKFREHIAAKSPDELYAKPVRPPEMVSVMGVHTIEGPEIQKKDWLSSIAGNWYGDLLLWPILFDFNKDPDFTNPNKMYVGQRVKIPFINELTPAQIKAYRQRGYNWK